MFMNEDDWPVIAPNRYAGETIEAYSKKQVIGEYKLINHGKDISKVNKKSVIIHLEKDGSISGNVSGNWKQTGDTTVNIILNNIT